MRYLSIKNFETHQHYKNRRPAWIKLHAAVLEDYSFSQLPDESKAHLMLLWVLASKLNNRIPDDADWITRQIGAASPLNLERLIAEGFVLPKDDASEVLAPCKQSAMPEKRREEKNNGVRDSYSPPFNELRAAYPKRSGGDSKDEAYRQYQARLKQGETHEAMLAGATRYKAYCDATGKTGTEYVKQMATFLGRSRHYLELWEIPAKKNGQHSADEFVKRGYV